MEPCITITFKQNKDNDDESYKESDSDSFHSETSGSQEEYEDEELSQSECDTIRQECEQLLEKVENLQTFINIGNYFVNNKKKLKKNVLEDEQYDYFYKCSRITPHLEDLENMVGLETCKKTIFLQLSYFLQGLHDNKLDMLHMVISGLPGVGKTQLAKIIGKIYGKMGILKHGHFVEAKRADLIGQHLGETAIKTTEVLKEAYGGVLFLDEGYSIGNKEGRDIFSKECIDTINQYLTEYKDNFMLILAGYKDSLMNCFFNYNPGLRRRFTFWIDIPNYDCKQLHEIFLRKLNDEWKIAEPTKKNAPSTFFAVNYKHFQNFGGDIETFIFYIKLYHSSQFKLKGKKKKMITYEDIKGGFELFKENKNIKETPDVISSMYI
jgi:SpoVK/Ycf46/Vps4 family AAA+-type ATPase